MLNSEFKVSVGATAATALLAGCAVAVPLPPLTTFSQDSRHLAVRGPPNAAMAIRLLIVVLNLLAAAKLTTIHPISSETTLIRTARRLAGRRCNNQPGRVRWCRAAPSCLMGERTKRTTCYRLPFLATPLVSFRSARCHGRYPGFLHLWSKCHTKLLFQAPYQCAAKRSERWLRPNCACWRPEWLIIDWNISRLSSAPTMAAIMSISLRCCRSMSPRNKPCASGASSKNRR